MKKLALTISFLLSLTLTRVSADLPKKIDRIVSSLPKTARIGVAIYDVQRKYFIYTRNPQELLIPASNLKLFTTGVALSMLGPKFDVATKVLTDARDISGGVLKGNLYLKGFGNPMMTDRDLDSIAKHIASLGIKFITGRIIGDDTYFDNNYERKFWDYDEETRSPLGPVSAVCINKNTATLVASKSGYYVSPKCSLISVRRQGNTVWADIPGNSFELRPRDKIRPNAQVYVQNPPLFAACLLFEHLKKYGVAVSNPPTHGWTPTNATFLTEYSVPLADLISHTNKHSDNYFAECIFKIIGARYSGSVGNTFYATQAVMSFFRNHFIFNNGAVILDGSGLSRFNQVSALTFVSFLSKYYQNRALYPYFYSSLSVAGVDGTLRHRLFNTYAFNNFHGKTGTLNGVTSITGYVLSRKKSPIVVSLIMDYNRGSVAQFKNAQDDIIKSLASDYWN